MPTLGGSFMNGCMQWLAPTQLFCCACTAVHCCLLEQVVGEIQGHFDSGRLLIGSCCRRLTGEGFEEKEMFKCVPHLLLHHLVGQGGGLQDSPSHFSLFVLLPAALDNAFLGRTLAWGGWR